MTSFSSERRSSTDPLTTDDFSSHAVINGVDDDLCAEILARLPLKPLFRFSCVSKGWRSLIASDYLRRRLPLLTFAVYYRRQTSSSAGDVGTIDDELPRFACTSDGDLRECSLDFFPFHRSSTVTDCCNGLLLSLFSSRSAFFVVSPITRRWVALPKPRARPQLAVLAFDPAQSSEFKVVSFSGWLARGAEVEVFSSETGQWAALTLQFGVKSTAVTATMRYFAGVLYILAYPNHVVAVDLGKNNASDLIELPEPAKADGRINGSAGVLHYAHSSDCGGRLNVWMQAEGEWVLKHCIDVGGIINVPAAVVHGQRRVQLMALHPEKEVVYLRVEGKLVAYDVRKKTKKVERVLEFGERSETASGNYVNNVGLFGFSRHMSDCLIRQNWKG